MAMTIVIFTLYWK